MGVKTQKTQSKGGCFADSATQYAGCALPFAGDAVFLAVTAAVGSTECIAINGLVRRATHVFGTDLGPL